MSDDASDHGAELDIGQVQNEAKVKSKKSKGSSGGFESMQLSPPIYRAVMKRGYRIPTPIQRKCIPVILGGRDMVAMARTGSGKTAAFLIPILEKLRSHASVVGARAVILSPTRELAMQTSKYVRDLAKFTDLSHCLLLGGDSMESQFEALANNPDIIIATPGRLAHIAKATGLSLKTVQFAVFDEADRLFEMGFAAQLRQILELMPEARQTLLFSATMPQILVEFTQAGLSSPEIVRLDAESKVSPNLASHIVAVRPDQKLGAFMLLMKNTINADDRTLIFACSRHHVEFIHLLLTEAGFASALIYGAMDASARKINFGKFRSGKARILVVTDVAARGLDLPLLDNVVNLHFPSSPKVFVHRVGRVARAGRAGRAFSIVDPSEIPYVIDLCIYLGTGMPGKHIESDRSADGAAPPTFGSLPSGPVDHQTEYCRRIVSHNTDLSSMERVCARGYKQYCKTRSSASPSSAVLAKEPQYSLRTMSVHPLFAELASKTEDKEYQNILEGIRSFKAKGTVFEIGKQDQVMKEIRGAHEQLMANHQKSIESAAIPEHRVNFRDEAHFVSAGSRVLEDAGRSNQKPATLNDLMVEVDGDDPETMRSLKSIRRWDQKKKKFFRLADGGNKRNEAGAKIAQNDKPIDHYQKWCSKNKKRIPLAGSSEEFGKEQKKGLLNKAGGRLANRMEAAQEDLPIPVKNTNGKRPRNELKAPEQINKERKKKAKINERMASKSKAKGKSRSTKGRRGK